MHFVPSTQPLPQLILAMVHRVRFCGQQAVMMSKSVVRLQHRKEAERSKHRSMFQASKSDATVKFPLAISPSDLKGSWVWQTHPMAQCGVGHITSAPTSNSAFCMYGQSPLWSHSEKSSSLRPQQFGHSKAGCTLISTRGDDASSSVMQTTRRGTTETALVDRGAGGWVE